MANINGGSQASFRWVLSSATMGLAASVSLCFAQGDRDTSKELQRVQPFACDSLDHAAAHLFALSEILRQK
jgi:hypothetical protein